MESQKKYWNIDSASGALLQALIHTHHPMHILEVGTSNGYSAILMGHVAKQYAGHIQTIEFFEERVKLARENIEQEHLSDTIEILQGDAMEILHSMTLSSHTTSLSFPDLIGESTSLNTWIPGQACLPDRQARNDNAVFDFVFLDANKEEYADYFTFAMQLMPNGGIIVADNTISHKNKLASFFQAVQNEPRANALELEIGAGLMVIKISPLP